MIELPEAVTISEHVNHTLRGKRINHVERGNSPHKFAFYSGSHDYYEKSLLGRQMGDSYSCGSFILSNVEPALVLIFGCGGERITYHQDSMTIPAKR